MRIHYYVVLVGIVALAIAGAFLRPVWARVACWILSVPPLAVGLFALSQGGIAEPFTRGQMTGFCAFAFAPAIGCTLGELSRIRRKS